MSHDYSFFTDTLTHVRRLRAQSYPYYILRAAQEIASPKQLDTAPKIISEIITETDETVVLDTTSYARTPGSDLRQLADFLGNALPADFLAFHQLYAEALVVTRSYPIHLWSESRIINETMSYWRLSNKSRPVRFFRIGEYFDRDAQQFGLWQESRDMNVWRVLVADHYTHDEDYDTDVVDPVYLQGPSFHDWLKDIVARDGLPDPFMSLDESGGFLDPA